MLRVKAMCRSLGSGMGNASEDGIGQADATVGDGSHCDPVNILAMDHYTFQALFAHLPPLRLFSNS